MYINVITLGSLLNQSNNTVKQNQTTKQTNIYSILIYVFREKLRFVIISKRFA